MPLATLRCSPDVHHFLCQAFIPACTEDNKVIRPCREQCETVLSDCEENIRIFGITWPPELQCDKYEQYIYRTSTLEMVNYQSFERCVSLLFQLDSTHVALLVIQNFLQQPQ